MSSSLTESQSADKPLGLSERQCPQRTPKSQVHPRPPSATGGRSRIPTNVHRNSMSGADSHGNLESPRAEAQKDSGRRLASKSFNSTIPKKPPNPPSGMQRRQLENQLHVKKNKYATLKKELMEKQKTAIEMYEDVVQLREKLIAAGGKDPGRIDAIQLLGGQTLHSPGGGEMTFVVDSTVTNEFVSNIQLQLDGTSKNLFDVCQDTLTKYSKVLHRLMSSRDQSREADAMLELKEFEVDHENLVTRLEAARKVEDELRSNVMGKVAILWSEIEACRIRIKHLENAGDDMVNQLRAKLNSEVEKLRELKERKSAVDGQLQKAKLRIKELEGKVEEEETKISQLQGNVKNLEGQLKHKDINGEQRLREVQKLLKNSEATVVKLENQRDSLESRLIELKKDLSNTEQVELLEKIIYLEEKSEILEKQLETLHPELSTCQQRVEHFVNEKLNIENHFQTKLEEKSNEIKDLQLNIETLERERDSFKQKVKDLESAPPVAPTSPRPQSKQSANPESENISYGSLEILKVNDGLRRNITDLKRTLKEVESELNTRSTQLQQKEKLLREQAKQLKIRDEMLAVMQGNRDKGNLTSLHKSGKDLVGKASLEELYSTLEDKQTQLVHLEKMVKQMEDQEKRAQEQRTRQEKRIAQLELTLQNKKNENRKRFGIL
ncbi:early endosome antigen 1 [Fopius arisanus]|uniref:Early endosome antigen 1 n=1 Tax=Fopius arisanus TaxID=64838 RepID=A0A0C9RFV2_9HYME|nr:PREDICTED: early endosome antigen 1-like [Fopius arisanus]